MQQPSLIRVAHLQRGDAVDGLLMVENANFKQNRAGKPFVQLTLRDQSGKIRALQWDIDRTLYAAVRVNDVIHVKGRVEEYQGQRQIIIDRIVAVNPEGASWEHFLPPASADGRRLWEELRNEVNSIGRTELKALLTSLLDDAGVAEALKTCPAGKTLHHAFRGGLLEHIVSIAGLARALKARWHQLDQDLLIAGAVLHDIGKIRELSFDRGFDYTDQGQLVGHVALGVALLHEKARALPSFPPELLMELEHIIVSHHGRVEFGALREPMTAEAIAIHFLDNLDARLSAYVTLVQDEQESPYGEGWTNLNPLFGTRLYRPERLRRKRSESPVKDALP
jgi:3'-5' exoribonuclease